MLIKAGFVQIDEVTGQLLRVLVLQYNPETLTRDLELVAPAPQPPRETIAFTATFDAADRLASGDPIAQQEGILPPLAALQQMFASSATSLVVWVSGHNRVVPVRMTGMQFREQAFEANLNTIRAEVSLTLQVLTEQELANHPRGSALLDAYNLTLQRLAELELVNGTLGALGLSGI